MPRVTIRVNKGFTQAFLADMKDLKKALHPETIEERIKQAIAQSFLAGMRSRYNSHEAEMNLQRRVSSKDLKGKLSNRDRERLAKLDQRTRQTLRQVAQEHGPGDIREVRDALTTRNTILAAYQTAKYRASRQKSDRGKMVHKALRAAALERLSRMRKVIATLTDRSLMKVEYSWRNGVVNGITVRVGNIAALDKIKTPSATEELSGHRSKSAYNILWRQMEFGTGVFAFPNVRSGGRYRTSAGTWWYGPKKGFGIHFAGNRPGQILRQRTGELYTADMMKFETKLRTIFSK